MRYGRYDEVEGGSIERRIEYDELRDENDKKKKEASAKNRVQAIN